MMHMSETFLSPGTFQDKTTTVTGGNCTSVRTIEMETSVRFLTWDDEDPFEYL